LGDSGEALAFLRTWGLLLLHDRRFPSLSRQIAGEAIAGSWWGHARGRDIFRAMRTLADDPDVALVKLLSGKVTFVHRRLWPWLMAVGMAREPWQTERLSDAAGALLRRLDDGQPLDASGPAVRELETRLLAASEEVHGATGAHKMRLLGWKAFGEARRQPMPGAGAAEARARLAALVEEMNARFEAGASLPWTGRA
jgi:hypothetical protein